LQSDEDLMTASAQGDIHAFEQIVQRYQASVWRVVCRFIRNNEEARDITQMVFMKLFEASSRYKKNALFKTYLFCIVNNICLDFIRKKRPIAQDVLPDILDNSPSQTDTLITNELGKTVRDAIERLPRRQQTAVILRYYADLSIYEIADIMNVTEKAVERLLAHARSALRSLFSEKI
jgi:RNA polymerase sigma-70 factor, ECF subfamily